MLIDIEHENDIDDTPTYVYDNCEVRLTGRTAARPLSSGKVDMLYEITPYHASTGQWKKWIQKEHMYQIQDNT